MKNDIIYKLSALATAAFGLVAALAWNSAIQAVFAKYYGTGEGIGAMLSYALVVTIIAVLVTVIIGKFAEKSKAVNLKDKIKLEKLKAISLKKNN